jgi:filamentous hemagglutinin
MEHYTSHVEEFGVKGMGAAEYQERADEFLGAQKPQGVLECVRRNGDRVRFNPATDEFGILSESGFIRTYFTRIG